MSPVKNKETKTRIKKNDVVVVRTGADRGRRGKVLSIGRKSGKVIVEGVNKKVRHIKPGPEQPKGGRLTLEYPIDLSNVMIFCDKCKKGVRIGIQYREKTKVRVCRKCGRSFD